METEEIVRKARTAITDAAMQRIRTKPLFNEDCPVFRGCKLFSDKWSMLCLMVLMQGTRRYSQLQRSLPDISPKMLAQTLRQLEAHGLVDRNIYPEVPPRVEYSLTAFGDTLRFPLSVLLDWSLEEGSSIAAAAVMPATVLSCIEI
ncbi:winged helix-turn-helix transcriptional regulator [Janthinobacterium sp. Mn2066]|uniref:winged helix-turn-helix transcriptional regulator n=1 Tax=Janthinobacterium sp. Mn2066 TaxID=3395264 RepID=UPI003BDA14AF